MLQNTTVADFLTEKFNGLGVAKNMKFKIFADAGFAEGSSIVYGSLIAEGSDGSPLQDFISRKYRYLLNFSVPDMKAGTRIKDFNEIVSIAVSDLQGKTFNLDGGEASFTLDIPHTNEVKIQGSIGFSVQSSFTINVVYTIGAVTASNKVWRLDGNVIPYLDESIDLEVQGQTNNIYGQRATQSLPMGQTKFYRFTLPFNSANAICSKLQRDMLSGDMTKVYSLEYYDGVSYTEAEPFKTTVSLFRTGNSGASTPSVSNFTVVFTDVDDGSKGTVSYDIALIDNPFDSGSVNVRYFTDRASQQAWYAEKIALGAPYSPIKAPNLNSLTITQQVYFKAKSCSLDLNSLLTKNYAIIRATDKASGKVLYYYYYYIQSANGGSDNQIFLVLNMDTVQTYYFDPNIKIPDCLIGRAHLNRWVENWQGTVKFDFSQSYLMENELDILPKILTSRKVFFPGIEENPDSDLNIIMHNYCINWVLIYLKYDETILKPIFHDSIESLKIKNIDTNMVCLCAPFATTPMYEGTTFFKIALSETNYPWDASILFEFLDNNPSLKPLVLNMKVTPVCPLASRTGGKRYKFVDNVIIITDTEGLNLKFNVLPKVPKEGEEHSMVCFLLAQSDLPAKARVFFNYKTSFRKSELINGNFNYKANPKYLCSSIYEIRLVDFAGNAFSYEPLKICAEGGYVLCNESLSADITKLYLRLEDSAQSYYKNGCDKSYMGLVSSNDTSIPFSVDKIDNFLANNKNYALMQQTQRDYNQQMTSIQNTAAGIKGAGSLINSVASKDIGGALSTILNTGVDMDTRQSTTSAQNSLSRAMQNMALDNMRSAPSDLKNAQGNVLFNMCINPDNSLSLYVEEHCALECDVIKAITYLNMFGFAYDYIANIKSIENIRHYFNYVQAQIESISGISISNDARNDIRRRFAQGIRFWNIDEIQYEKENYENWLAT